MVWYRMTTMDVRRDDGKFRGIMHLRRCCISSLGYLMTRCLIRVTATNWLGAAAVHLHVSMTITDSPET